MRANLPVFTNIGKYKLAVDDVNAGSTIVVAVGGGVCTAVDGTDNRSLGLSSNILRNGCMSAVNFGRRHGRYALIFLNKLYFILK